MQFSSSLPMSLNVLTGRIVRQRQPDALVVAGALQLALEIGSLERGGEAFLDAGRKLRLHVVGALLLIHLGVPCALSVG